MMSIPRSAHIKFVPVAWSHRLCILGFMIMVLIMIGSTGCATTSEIQTEQVIRQDSFWPQFPEEPRVQFLVSFRYSSDIEPKKSKLQDLLYGEESSVLLISKPYGIEMWDGKIYVCDIKNPGVVVLDLVKHQTRIMKTNGLGGMIQPTDIAIAPDGTKYVADAVRGVIFVFDANERQISSFGVQGLKPVGIDVYQDKLYISDFASKSVKVMDRLSGEVIQTIGGPGGEDGKFVRPLGIDVDKDGNIYVNDVVKCRLQKFDPQGNLIRGIGEIGDVAGAFARPKHVATDKSGIVYAVDAAFDNVQMFNEKGQLLMYFGSGGSHPGAMNLPAGVCTTDQGIELFKEYIHPAFKAERLILVTNQFGPNKVAVYAMGHLREGKTISDIAGNLAEMSSGIKGEDDADAPGQPIRDLEGDVGSKLNGDPSDPENQSNEPGSP